MQARSDFGTLIDLAQLPSSKIHLFNQQLGRQLYFQRSPLARAFL
ncbi:hypothetical protein LBWT_X2970 (plasmid) [Leptolyngbya boryana IAM M-101]|nr:hypothetical protein LBWT_X2970 [Leptolyngbya boryana IAM M-101]BAS66573.1 hypothetical protein LBDG_X2970 [Leptolyngbya boryana dg5]